MKMIARTLGLAAMCAAGCSSSNSPSETTTPDGGGGADGATVDAAPSVDAAEPPWSGQTVEPGCMVNGCIHAFTQGMSYTQAVLASKAATGQTVQNGIVIWTIKYMSDGVELTGSVYVPDSAPPAGGFAVVVMNQFTSGVGAPCAPSAGSLGIGVASPASLRGFLTIVPDATSYGGSKLGVYLDERTAGRAALDAARAAFHLGPALGLPVARRAVVAGLSQGGHSTMSAATEMPTYAPSLEIRGFAASAPPADFARGAQGVAQADTGFTWFLATRLYTWQQHFQLSGGAIFQDPIQGQIEGWLETECEFSGATGTYDPTLGSQFPDAPSKVLSPAFLGYAKGNTWPSDWAPINARSTPIPVGNSLPIVVWQGDADTTVPKADTDAYVAELKAAGVTVDYRIVPGGMHETTALDSFTVQQAASDDAYSWISQHLAE